MLKAAKSRFYLVPVLMNTLDILELLSTPDARFKLNEISDLTGVPLTTTYRILQTLVHRVYLAHDLEGKYSLANLPVLKALLGKHVDASNTGPSAAETNRSHDLPAHQP